MVNMTFVYVIVGFLRLIFGFKRINNDEFYLHFVGNKAFYENARVLTGTNAFTRLGQPCKICRKLDKYTVIFNRTHYARHRFAGREIGGIFFPSTKQFLVCETDAVWPLDRFYDGAYILTDPETVARMCNARHRNEINGN